MARTPVNFAQASQAVLSDGDEAALLRQEILDLTRRYAEIAHAPKPFVAGQSRVLVSGKVYDGVDVASLVDSALDFWLTTGRFNRAFEAKFAKVVGSKYALTVNSGSSANLVAVSALCSPFLKDDALKPGDEVITCATGFPTTVNPIIQNGLKPVFVDVELGTYNIDASQLEAAVSERTRAIVIAHALGNPFDLDAVTALARKHDLLLMEDCCDALGATYDGRHVGQSGAFGTVSFYPAHHITMGEGGAVFGSNPIYKRAAESVRDWGRDCWCEPGYDNTCGRRYDWQLGSLPHGYDHKYTYSNIGYNLKITDMQAAVGVSQLDKLEGFVAARRRNFDHLSAGLADLQEFLVLPRATAKAEASWFGFPITVKPGSPISRNDLVQRLNAARIDTRLLFGGNLVRQPYMEGRDYRVVGELAGSDAVVEGCFWLGVFPGLTPAHLDYVVDTLHEVFGAS